MGSRLILMVENNRADEKLALFSFKKNGLSEDLVVARNGTEALNYLLGDAYHAPQPLPSLILLDLKMPKVNGIEVLRHIRHHKRTQLIPVVILTSSLEPHDLILAYRLGANSYIRKPIDLAAFNEIVFQLKQYWFEVNQPPPQENILNKEIE